MRIEALKEFLAVVEYGSYTGAAKALYISQPGLSKHIAALEAEIGCKLFFDERPLILTEAGRTIMKYASSMVSQYDTMELQIKRLKNKTPLLIRTQDIAFFKHIVECASVVKDRVALEFPSVTFDAVRLRTHQTATEALLEGTVDVAFLFHIVADPLSDEAIPQGDGFDAVPIYESIGELRLGVPLGSPLLSRGELSLADFANQPFIAMAGRNHDSFIQDFRALCLDEGFVPQIELATVDRPHDFWTADHGNSVVFLNMTSARHYTDADGYLAGAYEPVRPFGQERAYYIMASMIMRKDRREAPLRMLFDYGMELETAVRAELESSPDWRAAIENDGVIAAAI